MLSMHIKLYISLKISQRNACVNKNKKRKKSLAQILVKITVIMLSCFLSWLPSNILFVVLMFKEKYPVGIIIWIIVAVVPINSVVSPVIFIVTNFKYKKASDMSQ